MESRDSVRDGVGNWFQEASTSAMMQRQQLLFLCKVVHSKYSLVVGIYAGY